MEKVSNEVDNILTKDASSFQEIKNKCLNLQAASGNGDSAHDTFSNKNNTKSKVGTQFSGSRSSKLDPSSSFKDATFSSTVKTCTWCTKYHPSKTDRYG
jgi:hypothetical protein